MTTDRDKVTAALSETLRYCCTREYQGYSLYDSHNGRIPFAAFGPTVSFYANQIVKRSPLNLRPVLGVKKGINPKGMGLFLFALSELNRRGIELESVPWRNGSQRSEMDFFVEWLRDNPSPGYDGYSWGYNFDWPKRDGSSVAAYTPSSVVTGFNARALYSYYRATGSDQVREVLNGCAEFIQRHIPVTEAVDGICYSYVPTKRDMTVNASLLAAETLAYADAASGTDDHVEKVRSVLEFTRSRQNQDGSWYYSFSIEDGRPKKQIDFHQGYVLESIYRLTKVYGLDETPYDEMLVRGLEFYRKRQFDEHGRALWRYPAKWPVDIHNQSQGIITFSLLKELYAEGVSTAEQVLEYTLREMRGRDGRFYYQQWPLVMARTPYMRWAQGWMIVALASALIHLKGSG